ncbi:hypothetical protein [uncultured Prevotella sp.]|nr:hypothetical protein [uncultured Prevotella sp.]
MAHNSGFEDAITEHDEQPANASYINRTPLTVYYHKYYTSEGTDNQKMLFHRLYSNQMYGYTVDTTTPFDINLSYPNQSLPSLRLYNAYAPLSQPTTGQITAFGFSAAG